ncbi:MAG: hypothetical protein CMJ64_23420 [Planctomycetaceae bacterium]|nr:hypothetical protein [Planctomycetaceae bacterium]
MWRAFFCGIGISLLILGAECLIVDRAVLAVPPTTKEPTPHFAVQEQAPAQTTREWVPPEWAPWTLISVGAVLVLYTASADRDSD